MSDILNRNSFPGITARRAVEITYNGFRRGTELWVLKVVACFCQKLF